EAAGHAVGDDDASEEEEGPEVVPEEVHDRDPLPVDVAEEGHHEGGGYQYQLYEQVELYQVRGENDADETRVDQEYVQEVYRVLALPLLPEEHFQPVLHVAHRVDGRDETDQVHHE